jgi:uncharacterized protein YgiB involved in biofilm formation
MNTFWWCFLLGITLVLGAVWGIVLGAILNKKGYKEGYSNGYKNGANDQYTSVYNKRLIKQHYRHELKDKRAAAETGKDVTNAASDTAGRTGASEGSNQSGAGELGNSEGGLFVSDADDISGPAPER